MRPNGPSKISKHYTAGFTIVELLIVVVVIAILAAITIVSYNGITSRASDSAAQTNVESAIKKLEMDKINNDTYPLTLDTISGGFTTGNDIRTEYSSDGTTYCVTSSSLKAKTDYFRNSGGGAFVSGKCPNHLGYAGTAGSYSGASIFGASAPTGSYQVFNDGGGSLWTGDRFYTTRNNGIRVVGARFWEPTNASASFLALPLSVRVDTQDWQGTGLSGWDSLGSPEISATYSGVRKAGTWTYVWFNTSVPISKAMPAAGPADMVAVSVTYDGSSYVAASPAMNDDFTQSSLLPGVYLSEVGTVGRSVSSAYPGSSAGYYYGIDMLFTAL